MGWARLADELSKIELAIKAMVDAILNRNQPPSGSGPIKPAIIILGLLLSGSAFAQEAPSLSISSALQSVNIPATIDQIKGKAVNAGFFYNWKDHKVQPTFTYAVAGQKVFSWGTWDYIDVGYASPNVLLVGTGLALNIPVIEKKWGITAPDSIQKVLNNVSLGLTPMIGLEEIGGKNKFNGGPGGYLKVSW